MKWGVQSPNPPAIPTLANSDRYPNGTSNPNSNLPKHYQRFLGLESTYSPNLMKTDSSIGLYNLVLDP